eukprot:4038235-Prymnesium_polylepis.1
MRRHYVCPFGSNIDGGAAERAWSRAEVRAARGATDAVVTHGRTAESRSEREPTVRLTRSSRVCGSTR